MPCCVLPVVRTVQCPHTLRYPKIQPPFPPPSHASAACAPPGVTRPGWTPGGAPFGCSRCLTASCGRGPRQRVGLGAAPIGRLARGVPKVHRSVACTLRSLLGYCLSEGAGLAEGGVRRSCPKQCVPTHPIPLPLHFSPPLRRRHAACCAGSRPTPVPPCPPAGMTAARSGSAVLPTAPCTPLRLPRPGRRACSPSAPVSHLQAFFNPGLVKLLGPSLTFPQRCWCQANWKHSA